MRKILVATDFSDASRDAAHRAAQLAAATGAELLLVHAFDAGRPGASIDARAAAELVAEDHNAIGMLLETERTALAAAGATALALRIDGSAAEVLRDTARAQGVDLVVVGSHGRTGLRRLLLGSVAEAVVRSCPVPVLVARGEVGRGFHRVLVGSDLGEQAERALAAAVALAAPGAIVDILHVLPFAVPARSLMTDDMRRIEDEAREAGAALLRRHRRDGIELVFSSELGEPREELLRRAALHQRDLLAVGSHGRGAISRASLGAVSDAVVRHAPCSVLVSH